MNRLQPPHMPPSTPSARSRGHGLELALVVPRCQSMMPVGVQHAQGQAEGQLSELLPSLCPREVTGPASSPRLPS